MAHCYEYYSVGYLLSEYMIHIMSPPGTSKLFSIDDLWMYQHLLKMV